jgi:hypothetical protein
VSVLVSQTLRCCMHTASSGRELHPCEYSSIPVGASCDWYALLSRRRFVTRQLTLNKSFAVDWYIHAYRGSMCTNSNWLRRPRSTHGLVQS